MEYREEIVKLKEQLGDDAVILAHYYQKDEVCQYADIIGDSYALAVAASKSTAKYIVFCGVYFMAESAAILANPDQRVLIPDREAGCPLADMANAADFEKYYAYCSSLAKSPLISIVYVNSSSSLKAAVGKLGGLTCTSSNAQFLVERVMAEGKRVFFLPDFNLGINTARRMELKNTVIGTIHRKADPENTSSDTKLFLWKGFCNVHARFSPMDIRKAKVNYPYAKILVHPECDEAVVAESDFAGSTSQIIKEVEQSPAGTTLFVGTELNLVNRLARETRHAAVFPLRESGCVNMNKITLEKLYQTLQSLLTGSSEYEVGIDETEKQDAKRALAGMIGLVEQKKGEEHASTRKTERI
ncbi:MAG: quinolinate synthase NadA [Spirochaetales bacterium]|nr:quinolinate synthase NadA [Spirochaetales bacterium]